MCDAGRRVRADDRSVQLGVPSCAGRSSVRRCDGRVWIIRKPRPHRSRPSCHRRRVSAIGFAGKESSDPDDPNDHSVAIGIAGSRAVPTIALDKCDRAACPRRSAPRRYRLGWGCWFAARIQRRQSCVEVMLLAHRSSDGQDEAGQTRPVSKRKAVPGDVCELPLGDGRFAYGRVLNDASIAVYRSISRRPHAPPIGEREFLFTIGVYDDVPGSAAAPVVGHDPFSSEGEAWPPAYKVVDPITGRVRVYHGGEIDRRQTIRPQPPSWKKPRPGI